VNKFRSDSQPPRALHAIHLEVACRHLGQAIASLRVAAALDPATARAAGGLHAVLVDAADQLATIPSSPGRPHPTGAVHGVGSRSGRPGDLNVTTSEATA
jgi:hypothetical protein